MELPIIPTLEVEGEKFSSFFKKVKVLAKSFYPSPLEANLEDITNYNYPPSLSTTNTISLEEVSSLFFKIKTKSAPGIDKIPNSFLKTLGKLGEILKEENNINFNPFYRAITIIINTYQFNKYFPPIFKKAKSIYLRKPGKSNYTSPKAQRPIALLNTLGKLIELATAIKIRKLAEENNLLPRIYICKSFTGGNSVEIFLQRQQRQGRRFSEILASRHYSTVSIVYYKSNIYLIFIQLIYSTIIQYFY